MGSGERGFAQKMHLQEWGFALYFLWRDVITKDYRRENMAEKRGQEYIEKLGLEEMTNAVKQAVSLMEVSGDEEIINKALYCGHQYISLYGKRYRLILFILKKDDTGYFLFNDNGGFSVAGPVTLDQMKEFASLNKDAAEYVLFAEVGNNLYTIV